MKKLAIIQPTLAPYRVVTFNKLTEYFDVTVYADIQREKTQFEGANNQRKYKFLIVNAKIKKLFSAIFIQRELLKVNESFVLAYANINNISIWLLLFKSKLFTKQKVYLHGQGLYNKKNLSIWSKLAYRLFFGLSKKYIFYNDFCKYSTCKKLKISEGKMDVVPNTLPIKPLNFEEFEDIKKDKKDILFIGRLRPGTNIELLLDIFSDSSFADKDIKLHIVGGGVLLQSLKEKYLDNENIVFWGAIYEEDEILKVSKSCLCGVYPGDAGLSIVHYMALGVVPIVHDSFEQHMGPEPAYLENNFTSLFFKKGSRIDLQKVIEYCLKNRTSSIDIAEKSLIFFSNNLCFDSAERFAGIIK